MIETKPTGVQTLIPDYAVSNVLEIMAIDNGNNKFNDAQLGFTFNFIQMIILITIYILICTLYSL